MLNLHTGKSCQNYSDQVEKLRSMNDFKQMTLSSDSLSHNIHLIKYLASVLQSFLNSDFSLLKFSKLWQSCFETTISHFVTTRYRCHKLDVIFKMTNV